MTSGAITGVIDRLEAGGYVRRESDASDRRKTVLVPRMDRVEQLAQLYAPIQEAMTKLWSTYSLDQLRLLADFVRKSSDATADAMQAIRAIGRLPDPSKLGGDGKDPQK
ncbi:MarR family transcriptional regulator [Ramlibacter ginsenosidimutans]|uniref:MarR family transcriptional regulator n=1 Tax=Ramlibacter ginsenosidimutans TaxID=502333 RepID=A0A934WPR8_9BURK|nr:MarR family transcriptional regulator [Ramlibacter ginsenosidimutans]MBK6008673.1 MarR family transcriptional regulator [Ramlibacter ginsenosidimutans]